MSKEYILTILKTGPMTPHKIVEMTSKNEGCDLMEISTQLFELLEEGRIDYAAGSKFKLAEDI